MLDSDDPGEMAAYIEAADRYFRELRNPRDLFAKPFVPLENAGYNVARLGYLLHHLDHQRQHTVVDFGAGMCWLTAILLRTGCRVIALDVSRTALALGAEAVREANLPADGQQVEFRVYDGFRIPIADGTVDRVACFDALHHVPNKQTVLRELHRILRNGGIACFVEPGPGHAASTEARQEAETWGVLEDEVDATALCALAEQVGFASSYVVPLPPLSDNNLEPRRFQQIRESDRTGALSWAGNDALVVLTKLSASGRDSRLPGTLASTIAVVACPEAMASGELFSVELRITNTGDTVWLALKAAGVGSVPLDYTAAFLTRSDPSRPGPTDGSVAVYRRYIEDHALQGTVSVGAQLWPVTADDVAHIDFGRGFLDHDIVPGESALVTIQMRAPAAAGTYRLTFDGVAEYLTWFGDRGSPVVHRYVTVGSAGAVLDSRSARGLRVEITLVEQPRPGVLVVSLHNSGEAVWLAHPIDGGGWVRVGLQTLAADGRLLDRDWRRAELPRDILPGESATLRLDLRDAPPEARAIRIDLVSELRCWFEDLESRPLTFAL